MKHNVYFGIALRIILLFSIGILMTYVTPFLHTPFGDMPYPEDSYEYRYLNDAIDPYWNWSATHYWFNAMCIALFMLSVVNCIVFIVKLVRANYDTSKW